MLPLCYAPPTPSLSEASPFPFQAIMKDKWMNMGYEEEDLKPYVEPVQDWNDIKRIEILQVQWRAILVQWSCVQISVATKITEN